MISSKGGKSEKKTKFVKKDSRATGFPSRFVPLGEAKGMVIKMIIALSSTGTSLESNVDSRFGRCPFFIFYNTEDDTFDHVSNEARGAMGGAGIQTGQMVASRGAKAVITGNVGPNAFKVLSAAGIKVYSGISGRVDEAVQKFKAGQLDETKGPDVGSHFGMGGGGRG